MECVLDHEFRQQMLRSVVDAIAEIDPELFNNKVGGLVMDIYNAIRSNGPASILLGNKPSWLFT